MKDHNLSLEKNQFRTPEISLIVPVFNVDKYLKRCLASIQNQTFKNFEVILIDDGSEDQSGRICDCFAKKDSRFKVIHQVNQGLSAARNTGLKKAAGQLISFVDSDDWIGPRYLENLYSAMNRDHADIACSWFILSESESDDELSGSSEVENYQNLNPEQALERLLYQDGIETSAWGKLYRKEVIQNLRYPVGMLYEDIPVTLTALMNSENIALIGNTDYFYFQRSESIQNQQFSLKKLDLLKNMSLMQEKISEFYPDLNEAAACRFFSALCNLYCQVPSGDFQRLRKTLWKKIRAERRCVLFNGKARKKARAAALVSYGGPASFRLMHRFQKKIKKGHS